MRSGASGYKTLYFVSGSLFLAAFGCIPAMIVLRVLLAIVRAWSRNEKADIQKIDDRRADLPNGE
jgi:hypothetical protein